MYLFYVSQILSYNVNIWRNLNQTVRQNIVVVNRRVFCMYGTVVLRSPIPTFLDRIESYNSAATYYIWWLHLGDLFKSERWSQPNLNDLLQQLQHLSVWCNHVLNRLKECSSFFISRKQRTVPAMVHVSISF